ncbi:hypothetical protein P3T73_15555 [Kiritimatiellota bacterium B12222]|nr:hypothetical protein P3T73_15555 [Kiritimatiellota bacterium B12222]
MNKTVVFFLSLTACVSLVTATPILIDFGGGSTGSPTYNNVTDGLFVNDSTALLTDLVDEDNLSTGISLYSSNWFDGTNNGGTTSPAPFSSSATKNSLFDANDSWSSGQDAMVVLIFEGLDLSKTYDFTMYASRMGANDNRSTLYSFAGGNSGSATLNPSNNIVNTTAVSGISPNESGKITLTMTPDAANDNGYDFIYLGAMEINVIPEPSSLILLVGAFGSLLHMSRRR